MGRFRPQGTFFPGILLFAAAVLPVLLAAKGRVFSLNGWEYARPLKLPALSVQREPFIHAWARRDRIHLLYTHRGKLMSAVYRGKDVSAPREVVPVAPYTVPVIKEKDGELYLMVYDGTQFRVLRYSREAETKSLISLKHDNPFNYDLFVTDNQLILALPRMVRGEKSKRRRDMKHLIELRLYNRQGEPAHPKPIPFPEPAANERGMFFPRLMRRQGLYRIFYVVRRQIKRRLVDSIYYLQTPDLRRLPSLTPNRDKIPNAISDHPPRYIHRRGKTYILLTRKVNARYNLKILRLGTMTEYSISKPYVHSYKPEVLRTGNTVDVFFTVNNRDRYQLGHRAFQLDELADLRDSDISPMTIVTAKNRTVRTYSAARLAAVKYLFFIEQKSRQIYISQTDISVPRLRLRQTVKTDYQKAKRYIEFSWSEPDDPSGIRGYIYTINIESRSVPDGGRLERAETVLTTEYLNPGAYYLHIRAIDGRGNLGPIEHVPFFIRKVERRRRANRGTSPRAIPAPSPPAVADIGSYSAFHHYIEYAQVQIGRGNLVLARRALNLSALVLPDRMETYFLLQEIARRENRFWQKYRFPLLLGAVCAVILSLIIFYAYLELKR